VTELHTPLVRVGGDPDRVGAEHGRVLRDRLRGFLADGNARLDYLLPHLPEDLDDLLDAYDAAITAQAPALGAEIGGLADGAGIRRRDAVLLQVRRELLGYSRIPTRGDCTTYARGGPGFGTPVLAQTVDLNGGLDDQIAVLDVEPGPGRIGSLVLSFGGLLGYLGVNDAGLAVGLNLVLGGTWGPGMPPYLAIRHVLDRAGSVDEAVALLRGLRVASSRSVMLCDRTGVATLEFPGGGPGSAAAMSRFEESVHTNHFLESRFASRDALNVFARNSSNQRLTACASALAALPDDAGPEQHLSLLAAPPITVRASGDIRRERTVAAVALLPGRGELHLRPGDPSRSSTRVFGTSRQAVPG